MGIAPAFEQLATDEDRQIRQQFEKVLAKAKRRPVISSRQSFIDKPYTSGDKADAVAAIDCFVEEARAIYCNPTHRCDVVRVHLGYTTLLAVRRGDIEGELKDELSRRGYSGFSIHVHTKRYESTEHGYLVDAEYYLVASFMPMSDDL